jgi:transcriptional antiterminator NusG
MSEMDIIFSLEELSPEEIEEYSKKEWYVVHTYSGYESKVQEKIAAMINEKGLQKEIEKVFLPVENVIEIKRGEKHQVSKKIFPGYILLQINDLTDDVILEVKNIQGVTDFVRAGQEYDSKPLPLPKSEIKNLLEKAISSPSKPKTQFEVGDAVSIMSGPFMDFVGIVDEVDIDKGKLKLMVDIFGRKTAVELNFDQVEKQPEN